mmetsp:Transcript_99993/g.322396  ORF Transcript_99993/g.322396 Transcript_99993/m.322396 type:complete len:247 (+) Transcript_99993:388-1128(+)
MASEGGRPLRFMTLEPGSSSAASAEAPPREREEPGLVPPRSEDCRETLPEPTMRELMRDLRREAGVPGVRSLLLRRRPSLLLSGSASSCSLSMATVKPLRSSSSCSVAGWPLPCQRRSPMFFMNTSFIQSMKMSKGTGSLDDCISPFGKYFCTIPLRASISSSRRSRKPQLPKKSTSRETALTLSPASKPRKVLCSSRRSSTSAGVKPASRRACCSRRKSSRRRPRSFSRSAAVTMLTSSWMPMAP